jgi:hypothetical protein
MKLRVVCGSCHKMHKLTIRTEAGKKKFSCRLKVRWWRNAPLPGEAGDGHGEMQFSRRRGQECRIYKLHQQEGWLFVGVIVDSKFKIYGN